MTASGGSCVYNSRACDGQIYNMNVDVVPFTIGPAVSTCTSPSSVQVKLSRGEHCTAGTSTGNNGALCGFACQHGFCPKSCICTAASPTAPTMPVYTAGVVCATKGQDPSFGPLCSFSCKYGFCPPPCIADKAKCLAQVDPGASVANEDEPTRLARLDKMYPGIWWGTAMPSKGSCTTAQLDILEEATRVAALMTHESVPDTEIAAFQRYFVTDGRVSRRWNNQHRTDYMNLLSKLFKFS